MNHATYIKNFKGRKIPKDLENLLAGNDNLDTLSEELSKAGVYFTLEKDSDAWLTHWLGYPSQIVDSVLGIATNGAGDLLAFWLYDQRDLENAPIVFVGHEGNVSVIANNFSDLLLLLTACFDLHPDTIPENLTKTSNDSMLNEITRQMIEDGFYPPDTIQHARLRDEEIKTGRADFVRKMGLQPPQYPAALMRSAIQSHPDFQVWLDRQISMEQPDSLT
jgi:hypothetical protein